MFSRIKIKKVMRLSIFVITIIFMCINNFSIDFNFDKRVHLSLNNSAYAAEFDPAIDICPIVAGGDRTLALMRDRTVKSWGDYKYTPTLINGLTEVNQIAVGDNHALALMYDGTIKVWGLNNIGELGPMTETTYFSTPTNIFKLTGAKKIATGSYHTIALMNDETILGWGYNGQGQLGLGNTMNIGSPVVISGLKGVKQIVAVDSHSLALMNDGTVKAWGNNSNGQLGLGDTASRNTPTVISGLTGVKQIAAGNNHTLALMNDGTVKAWGYNAYGQLGLGDTVNRYTPTVINGLEGVKQIVAGGYHTLALMNDGTVKVWGYNIYGLLGLGDTTNRNTPTVINGLTGVKQITAGTSHSVVLMNDGTVRSWGYNSAGQLGLGDTNHRYLPTEIVGLKFNFFPNLNIQNPLSEYKFTALQDSFNPSIEVSDSNNDTLTCKYYFGSETVPREIKTVSNTASQQIVTFNPFNLKSMYDGSYNLRFEISDGQETVKLSTNFIVDRETPTVPVTIFSSDAESISVEGIVQYSNLYRYTIGTTSTDWIKDTSYKWKELISNTAYNLKFDAKDNEGNIITDQKTIYTKAQSPEVYIGNIDKAAFDIHINDSNPSTTEYQIVSGTKYVSATGTLTSTPTWITIPNKVLNITGLAPNLKYSFKVKARNGEGIETQYSAPVEINTLTDPPSCPSGLAADPIKVSNSTIVLNWDSITTATSYDIEVDGVIKSTTKPIFEHMGLSPNTQHTYRVRAKNIYGVSEWSPIVTAMTTNNPPGMMGNINSYVSNKAVILTWDEVRDAESYEVEFDGSVVDNGPNSFCAESELLPNTQHSYRIRTINSIGDGEWSTLSTINTKLLNTPVNIKVVEDENEIDLSWDAVESANGYDIEINGQAAGTVTTNSYKHTALPVETGYTYRIKAKNSEGESAWSDTVSAMTLPQRPKVPENISGHSIQKLIVIKWDPVDGAIGYDVELDGVLTDNGNSTRYTHEDLSKSTYHTYRVRAKNNAIEGQWSRLLRIKTMAGIPTAPQNIAVDSTITITTLSWESQADALGYDIEVDGQVIENLTQTSYRHRRIVPGTEHVYRLRTKNISGISPWSGYIINNALRAACKKNGDVDLGLTASDIIDFSKYTLTVTYNKDVLDVTDLCTFSPKIELTKGAVEGTGITITEYTPGKIVFVVDKSIPPGESWTGVINSIKFKVKVSGGTNITYTVFSKPEE